MSSLLVRASVLSLLTGLAACSSSSTSNTPATPGTDGGASTDSGTTTTNDSGTTTPDAATTAGLTLSDATVASINGTYPIEVYRIANGAALAWNGNFDSKIEIEIDTDAAGVVKTAHVWNYKGTAPNLEPDKFYGCDGKATACTGVTVNTTTNLITITGVVWPEVASPDFSGAKADTVVSGGAKVTVTANITAKVQ